MGEGRGRRNRKEAKISPVPHLCQVHCRDSIHDLILMVTLGEKYHFIVKKSEAGLGWGVSEQ